MTFGDSHPFGLNMVDLRPVSGRILMVKQWIEWGPTKIASISSIFWRYLKQRVLALVSEVR